MTWQGTSLVDLRPNNRMNKKTASSPVIGHFQEKKSDTFYSSSNLSQHCQWLGFTDSTVSKSINSILTCNFKSIINNNSTISGKVQVQILDHVQSHIASWPDANTKWDLSIEINKGVEIALAWYDKQTSQQVVPKNFNHRKKKCLEPNQRKR